MTADMAIHSFCGSIDWNTVDVQDSRSRGKAVNASGIAKPREIAALQMQA